MGDLGCSSAWLPGMCAFWLSLQGQLGCWRASTRDEWSQAVFAGPSGLATEIFWWLKSLAARND